MEIIKGLCYKSVGCPIEGCLYQGVVHTGWLAGHGNCTKKKKPLQLPCAYCDVVGHHISECHEKAQLLCPICKKNGHLSESCKFRKCNFCNDLFVNHNEEFFDGTCDKEPVCCFICKKPNHCAQDCKSRFCGECELPFHCHDKGCFDTTCNKVLCTNCGKMGNHLAPACFLKQGGAAAAVQKKQAPFVSKKQHPLAFVAKAKVGPAVEIDDSAW